MIDSLLTTKSSIDIAIRDTPNINPLNPSIKLNELIAILRAIDVKIICNTRLLEKILSTKSTSSADTRNPMS